MYTAEFPNQLEVGVRPPDEQAQHKKCPSRLIGERPWNVMKRYYAWFIAISTRRQNRSYPCIIGCETTRSAELAADT